jgi:hypothetical protein
MYGEHQKECGIQTSSMCKHCDYSLYHIPFVLEYHKGKDAETKNRRWVYRNCIFHMLQIFCQDLFGIYLWCLRFVYSFQKLCFEYATLF